MKGIIINSKHSYSDLNARVLERNIAMPEKKTAFVDDIPFMDAGYDFTTSLHRVYWGFREAEYTFRITGSRQSEAVHDLLAWLGDVTDADIYDEFENGWHLHGSLKEEPDVDEDISRWYSDVTATFQVSPYWIADEAEEWAVSAGAYDWDNDGQATSVTAEALSEEATVQLGGSEQTLTAGEVVELEEELKRGSNLLVISEGSEVMLRWHKTRF